MDQVPSVCSRLKSERRVSLSFQSAILMCALALSCLVVLCGGSGRIEARESFGQFVQSLWPEAEALGVSRETFDKAFQGLRPNLKLPDLVLEKPKPGPGGSAKSPKKVTGKQAEFTRPPRSYLNAKTLRNLASTGRQLERKHRAVLKRIEKEIGVDRFTVLAIWGRETSFGRYKLPHDAIRVLATQAYVGRRSEMFRKELLYALKMLEDGVPRRKLRSSWAGAIGQTQFLPTEYYKHAKSFSGGKVDLLGSVDDALASAALQLKNKGWIADRTWGYEVAIPASASCALEGPPGARPIRDWMALGFGRVGRRSFPDKVKGDMAYLMSPAGAYGPSFLVLENFQVIRRYNTSDLYATFVGNLADRISGGGDFLTSWKGQGRQKTRVIRGVQQALKDKGYPIGKVDGFIGSGTRRQVGIYQEKNKLKVDCWPTEAVLAHMRK